MVRTKKISRLTEGQAFEADLPHGHDRLVQAQMIRYNFLLLKALEGVAVWNLLHYYATDFVRLCDELYKSPAAFPVALAILWRTRTVEDIVHVVTCIGMAFAIVSTGQPLQFLDPQYWTESFFHDQRRTIEIVQQQIPEWIPKVQASGRAMTLAFSFFALLLCWNRKELRKSLLRCVGLIFAASVLTCALYMAWIYFCVLLVGSDISGLTEKQILMKARFLYDYWATLPELAAATAMLCILVSTHTAIYLKRSVRGITFDMIVLNIICPCLILTAAITGFLLLGPWQAFLFLVFMLIAYPFCLAFTRTEAADLSILQRYKLGAERLAGLVTP